MPFLESIHCISVQQGKRTVDEVLDLLRQLNLMWSKYMFLNEKYQFDTKEITMSGQLLEPIANFTTTFTQQSGNQSYSLFIHPDVLNTLQPDENDFFRVQVS